MNYDADKVDEMTLALLCLGMTRQGAGARAWRVHDLAVLDRLHAQGWIARPSMKSPTLDLTPEGARRAEELFRRHFGKE